MKVLVLEDKLGITSGYMGAWDELTKQAGFNQLNFVRYSLWKSPAMQGYQLLIKSGNRKSPGFNPDPRIVDRVRSWFTITVNAVKPDAILVMDVALLGVLEPSWDIATIDHLRGGVYHCTWGAHMGSRQIPILVTVPISAINNRKKTKDIKALNEGAESQDEWDEMDHDPEELFFEPYTIPYGRWVLARDLKKLYQLLNRVPGVIA